MIDKKAKKYKFFKISKLFLTILLIFEKLTVTLTF